MGHGEIDGKKGIGPNKGGDKNPVQTRRPTVGGEGVRGEMEVGKAGVGGFDKVNLERKVDQLEVKEVGRGL